MPIFVQLRLSRRHVGLALLFLSVLLVAGLWAWSTGGASNLLSAALTPVYRVRVDERFVGYVDKPETARTAVALVEQRESSKRPYEVVLASEILVEKVKVNEQVDPLTAEELATKLAMTSRLAARGVAIVVDGEPTVVVASEEAARAAVETLVDDYRARIEQGQLPSPGGKRSDETVKVASVQPVQQIEYRMVTVEPADIKSAQSAAAILSRGTHEYVTHTVQHGESLWTIARNNDLSVEELQAANPQVDDPERLRPGDQLSLIVPRPFITLRSVETRRYRAPIPFRTRYETDSNLYRWEEYVRQPGQPGEREVVERVERVDGKIVAVETVRDQVLREPQVQIVVRGGKSAPHVGTGIYRWPVAGGELSDSFGWSSWRGRRHEGIDIAAPAGTPVYAADTGVVAEAGWRGAYGRMIVLDHGGGQRATVYAHLSQILVKPGQRVEKGQIIGRVGSTGFATGPHLHFEVQINGRSVDPLTYFRSR